MGEDYSKNTHLALNHTLGLKISGKGRSWASPSSSFRMGGMYACHTHTYAHAHPYAYVYTYTCTCICTYTYTYTYTERDTHIHQHLHVHLYVHLHVHLHIHIHTLTHIHILIQMLILILIHIHIPTRYTHRPLARGPAHPRLLGRRCCVVPGPSNQLRSSPGKPRFARQPRPAAPGVLSRRAFSRKPQLCYVGAGWK